MIAVQELHKSFQKKTAVDAISFSVDAGQIIGFLGPNGAGKTTTMRMIMGVLTPTSGSIMIDGKKVVAQSIDYKKRIGYLPEGNPLYENMLVYEYLEYIAGVKQVLDTQAQISQAVKWCFLEDVLTQTIQDLSKGYKQRVGLAAALIGDPDILILDEPTSGLDPNQAQSLLDLIQELGKTRTIIFSTHILHEVEAVCDRVVIMNTGSIVADGKVEDVLERDRVQVQYVVAADCSIQELTDSFKQYEEIAIVEVADDPEGFRCTIQQSSNSTTDMRRLLFAHAVTNGWTIIEMYQEQASLDELFKQLTNTTTTVVKKPSPEENSRKQVV